MSVSVERRGAEPTAKPPVGYAAVLGDVVGSRQARHGMFAELAEALEQVNARIPALQSLQLTIGDEFQGVYSQLGSALNATLLLRLLLHSVTEVRFGLGWGALTRWDPERAPFGQDGPAWWAARAALEEVAANERRSGTPDGCRTAVHLAAQYRGGPRSSGPESASSEQTLLLPSEQYLDEARPIDVGLGAALEGLLTFRDHVAHRLDDRDVGIILALLEGATVTEGGERVGISQQAASRRLRTNGGYALLRSWDLFEGGR